jgi:hypothetical protein
LPKSKTKALNNDLHLLPDDLQFNSERLLKLFLKPHFKVMVNHQHDYLTFLIDSHCHRFY